MKRSLFLLFGMFAYILFFATFLYLVGFVADFGDLLPRTVDQGPLIGAGPALAIDLALVALFGLQHSVMARQGFKRAWTRIVPPALERSVYVVAASLALILLFAFWHPIPATIWRVEGAVGAAILWAICAAGWLIVLLSTFLISHFELFGLKQVYLHARGEQPAAPEFRQPFFYRMVRHPLYAGFFLAFWATPHMTVGHVVLAVALSTYMLIAIRYEERDLVNLFGDRYVLYRRDVGMLTPRMPHHH